MDNTSVEAANMNETAVVRGSWDEQAWWSELASQLKRDIDTWRMRSAVAGVVGAFLVTLATSFAPLGPDWALVRTFVALAGAVVLAVVPFVASQKAQHADVQRWVSARSASELLKELIYRYLVGATPFGPQPDARELVKRRGEITRRVSALRQFSADVHPVAKERPLKLSIDDYVEQRLNDQINNYYETRGRENAKRAADLRRWVFGLGALSVALGAASGIGASGAAGWLSGLGPWVAVVTTAGAAVGAHLAAGRYDHNAVSFLMTASHLRDVRDAFLVDPRRHERDSINAFVNFVERAISSENEAWLAEWRTPPPSSAR
jgi:hypothetical protein